MVFWVDRHVATCVRWRHILMVPRSSSNETARRVVCVFLAASLIVGPLSCGPLEPGDETTGPSSAELPSNGGVAERLERSQAPLILDTNTDVGTADGRFGVTASGA